MEVDRLLVLTDFEFNNENFSFYIFTTGNRKRKEIPVIMANNSLEFDDFPTFAEGIISLLKFDDIKIFFSTEKKYSDFVGKVFGIYYDMLSEDSRKILSRIDLLSRIDFLLPEEPDIPFWEKALACVTCFATKFRTDERELKEVREHISKFLANSNSWYLQPALV
jgi:hypothetical protein